MKENEREWKKGNTNFQTQAVVFVLKIIQEWTFSLFFVLKIIEL